MVKVDAYSQGRSDGLALALRIVKKDGIEGLEKEIRFRNITGINTRLDRKELEEATVKIKKRTVSTVLLLSLATIRDEFGFGHKRAQRFVDRFKSKAACIMDDMSLWEDYRKAMQEELNVEIEMFDND